jgi:hypothetical protein
VFLFSYYCLAGSSLFDILNQLYGEHTPQRPIMATFRHYTKLPFSTFNGPFFRPSSTPSPPTTPSSLPTYPQANVPEKSALIAGSSMLSIERWLGAQEWSWSRRQRMMGACMFGREAMKEESMQLRRWMLGVLLRLCVGVQMDLLSTLARSTMRFTSVPSPSLFSSFFRQPLQELRC